MRVKPKGAGEQRRGVSRQKPIKGRRGDLETTRDELLRLGAELGLEC